MTKTSYFILKPHIFCIIITLGILSCKDNNSESKKTYDFPKIIDTLTYDFGYAVNFMHCGVFEENGKEYFFFSNVNTAKKITILDEDFKIVQQIDLKSKEFRSYDLQDVQVINSDSILLFADYKYLLAIDSTSRITGKCDLSKIKTEDGLYPYTFTTSVSGPFGFENGILVSSLLNADLISESMNLPHWDFWEKINNLNFDYDQMLFIENPFDKNKNVNRIKYHAAQINKDHFYNGPFYSYKVGKDVVLSSHFNNFIVRYNFEQKVLDSIQIHSKFTKIGTESPSYKAVRVNRNMADWNIYYRGTPKIYRMFLNKYNGDISVFIDLPYEERDIGTDKPKWIWQSYDKDFSLIAERQILHTNWGFGAVFNSAKGIMMIDNNYQNPNKPFERKMFVFK